jgi:hypothetical protein
MKSFLQQHILHRSKTNQPVTMFGTWSLEIRWSQFVIADGQPLSYALEFQPTHDVPE